MAESENTILHTHVLAELFKDTYLVDLATNPADAMESARSTSNIKKEVLVCVATNEENLPPSKEALLQAILSACKLNMDQVGIITNQLQIQNNFLSLVETHQAKKIILFGWDPAAIGLPIHFPVFQICTKFSPNFGKFCNTKKLDNFFDSEHIQSLVIAMMRLRSRPYILDQSAGTLHKSGSCSCCS